MQPRSPKPNQAPLMGVAFKSGPPSRKGVSGFADCVVGRAPQLCVPAAAVAHAARMFPVSASGAHRIDILVAAPLSSASQPLLQNSPSL